MPVPPAINTNLLNYLEISFFAILSLKKRLICLMQI